MNIITNDAPHLLIVATLAIQLGLPLGEVEPMLGAFLQDFHDRPVDGETQIEAVGWINNYIRSSGRTRRLAREGS